MLYTTLSLLTTSNLDGSAGTTLGGAVSVAAGAVAIACAPATQQTDVKNARTRALRCSVFMVFL